LAWQGEVLEAVHSDRALSEGGAGVCPKGELATKLARRGARKREFRAG
jgi:hypothetical protein